MPVSHCPHCLPVDQVPAIPAHRPAMDHQVPAHRPATVLQAPADLIKCLIIFEFVLHAFTAVGNL